MARFIIEVEVNYVEEVQRNLRAMGIRPIEKAFNYILVDMPPELAPKVEELPHVVRVTPERPMRITAIVPVEKKLLTWLRMGGAANPLAQMWSMNVDRFLDRWTTDESRDRFLDRWTTDESRRVLGAHIADAEGVDGRGVKVAVLDTGYDNLCPQLPPIMFARVTTGEPTPFDVDNGHGTWCITCIAGRRLPTPWGNVEGVAKGATLASIRCLGYVVGSGSNFSVMKAMEMAYQWGADIVSMSLGGTIKPDERHNIEECPLCQTVESLSRKGMIFVIAAGNDGEGHASCPGIAPSAITVGALDKEGIIADFSSRRHAQYVELKKPDVVAPGVRILSSTSGMIDLMQWMDGLKLGAISGTCLTKDTIIYTPDGPVELGELKVGDTVYSYSYDGRVTVGKVMNVIDRGIKKVYEVITGDGRRIVATANHPVLVAGGGGKKPYWRRVDQLKVNRHQLVIATLPPTPVEELDELISVEVARALGYLLADGWVTRSKGNWQICTAPDGEWFFKALGIPFKPYEKGRWLYTYSKRLALALTLLGFKQPHDGARIPKWVYHLSREKIRAFIDGFARGDAHIDKQSGFRLELASERLVRDLKHLCDWATYKAYGVKYRERVCKPPGSKEPRVWRTWKLFINPGYEPRSTTVKEVRELGEDHVYDLTITPYPHFIAEGIVVHNSMATPHVAGLLALWKQYLRTKGIELTPSLAKEIIREMGKSWSPDYGYGCLTYEWIKEWAR